MNFVPHLAKRPKSSMRKEREIHAFRRWIKRHVCSVKGCGISPCDPSHTRVDLPADAQRGGTGLRPGDAENIIPLCREHHAELHTGERTFYAKYGINAVELGKALWERWVTTTVQGRKYKMEHS